MTLTSSLKPSGTYNCSYASINSTLTLKNNGLSIAGWFNASPSCVTNSIYIFKFQNTTNNIGLKFNTYSLETNQCQFKPCSISTYADNNWHHFVWTLSKDDNKWNFYIDSSLNCNITCQYNTTTFGTNDITIGSRSNASSTYSLKIHDFIIYNKVISQSQVTQLYNTTTLPTPGVTTH